MRFIIAISALVASVLPAFASCYPMKQCVNAPTAPLVMPHFNPPPQQQYRPPQQVVPQPQYRPPVQQVMPQQQYKPPVQQQVVVPQQKSVGIPQQQYRQITVTRQYQQIIRRQNIVVRHYVQRHAYQNFGHIVYRRSLFHHMALITYADQYAYRSAPLLIFSRANGLSFVIDGITYYGWVCYRETVEEDFICVPIDSRYVNMGPGLPSMYEMLTSGDSEKVEEAKQLAKGTAIVLGLDESEFNEDNPGN